MAKKTEVVQETFSEKLKNMAPEERVALQEELMNMTPEELANYRNAMNPDEMGFDGEEAPTYEN